MVWLQSRKESLLGHFRGPGGSNRCNSFFPLGAEDWISALVLERDSSELGLESYGQYRGGLVEALANCWVIFCRVSGQDLFPFILGIPKWYDGGLSDGGWPSCELEQL